MIDTKQWDIPPDLYEYEFCYTHIGGVLGFVNQETWNNIKKNSYITHFGNEYMQTLFNFLSTRLECLFPEINIDYSIDGKNSYFNFDNENLTLKSLIKMEEFYGYNQ